MATTLRARPAALNLTASAEARIAELMRKAPEGAIGVKLSTPRRGCSGLAYSVDYVEAASAMDERIETPGGVLFVDGASLLYLMHPHGMDALRDGLVDPVVAMFGLFFATCLLTFMWGFFLPKAHSKKAFSRLVISLLAFAASLMLTYWDPGQVFKWWLN